MTHCAECKKRIRRQRKHEERMAAFRRGIEVLERGGRYTDAALAAGYKDAFQFSRAVYNALGERPRDLLRHDWRNLLAA